MTSKLPIPIHRENDFTRDEMEAALCLWEAMLDLRGKIERLDTEFGNNGAWEMRCKVIGMADHCERVWQLLTDHGKDDTVTFDWEFCPAYIAVWIEADCQQLALADCVAKINVSLGR